LLTSQETNAWLARISETGFYQAFSLVFLSEIGDKTFFIAGLLAMKTSRFISFLGSMGALIAMTVVSVLIGQVFHAVPSGLTDGIPLDDIAAVLAFTFFGVKTLREALAMESTESTMDSELNEAKETVEGQSALSDTTAWGQIASIFALVFAAEFGDRSFLSTIALSAAQNPVSVAGGAIAAHALATGVAVSSGAVLAKYISERVIGLIGGTLFLVFAVTTALGIF
jgi:putative Ca2+/H+ antiporter (TMEM165/GDT1 family)